MQKYDLNNIKSSSSILTFRRFLKNQNWKIISLFFFIILNTAADVLTPFYIARAIDEAIGNQKPELLTEIGIILGVLFIIKIFAGFLQSTTVGNVSQISLLKLRTEIFSKIQELPMSFFVANKTGDLISRINNDSDKLNQTLSFSVVRFFGSFFVTLGIGVFIFFLNPLLATITVIVALGMFTITRFLSPWIRKTNKKNSQKIGEISSVIEENLNNFRIITAFNRRDFFRESLKVRNEEVRKSSFMANISSSIVRPIYDFGGRIAQLIILIIGIYLTSRGDLSIGFLIAFISYTQRFYDPLSILGFLWSDFQSAIASWSRVSEVLDLESDLIVKKSK